jgi:hypothetical protein
MDEAGQTEVAATELDEREPEPAAKPRLPLASGLVLLGADDAEQCSDGTCW